MIAETAAVFGIVKNAIDIGKQAKEAVSLTEKQEKIEALLSKLIDIQIATLDLVETNHQLKVQCDKHAEFELERTRYVLHELAPSVMVYRFQGGPAEQGAPPAPEHYICADCFEKHQKSFLQRSGQTLKGIHYSCNSCKSEVIDHSKHIDAACATVEVAGRRRLFDGY